MSEEYVVAIDERDIPTAIIDKSKIHHEFTTRHRAFSIFLFDKDGQLLMQQRAHTKKTWPGIWSNSCCGHPKPQETYLEAAHRRLQEELGITSAKLEMALPNFSYQASMQNVMENELCPVIIGHTAQKPNPNPKEVADTKWISWPEFVKQTKDPSTKLSQWCIWETQQLQDKAIVDTFLARINQHAL